VHGSEIKLELDNRSGQVEFVFMSNFNRLKISHSEPNPFIERVEKSRPESNLFIKQVDLFWIN